MNPTTPESIIPGFAAKHNAAVLQANHFEMVRCRSSHRCVGLQGLIAGFPCDVLIVDDPYPDHLEARSLVVRKAVWNNFVSVLLPRLVSHPTLRACRPFTQLNKFLEALAAGTEMIQPSFCGAQPLR